MPAVSAGQSEIIKTLSSTPNAFSAWTWIVWQRTLLSRAFSLNPKPYTLKSQKSNRTAALVPGVKSCSHYQVGAHFGRQIDRNRRSPTLFDPSGLDTLVPLTWYEGTKGGNRAPACRRNLSALFCIMGCLACSDELISEIKLDDSALFESFIKFRCF